MFKAEQAYYYTGFFGVGKGDWQVLGMAFKFIMNTPCK